jgi:hypothetical protein
VGLRRLVVFLLGVAVIVDALADGDHLAQLIVGAVLIGIVPVDEFLSALHR